MSDAHRRYGAIQTALMQLFGYPTGHKARHVQTLAALICGIVSSTHTPTSRALRTMFPEEEAEHLAGHFWHGHPIIDIAGGEEERQQFALKVR